MRGRRLGVPLVVASTVAWATVPGTGALAAPAARSVPAPSSADAGRPARDSVPARPLESTLPVHDARAATAKIATPGRVQVAIALSGHRPFMATVHADGKGMAACQGTERGFSWIWGQTPTLQTRGQCSTTGY